MLPEKEEYLIGVEGGVFTIYFETNVDVEKLKVYTSSEPGSWLRQETTSRSAASETHEVSLHATSNKGGMSRSAYLLFVREEDGVQKELATVKISQQGGQVLESVDFQKMGKSIRYNSMQRRGHSHRIDGRWLCRPGVGRWNLPACNGKGYGKPVY